MNYIGFSKPKGNFKIFGWAIQLIEKRDFSHAYIVIDDMVYHASRNMVHCIKKDKFLENNKEVVKYKIVSEVSGPPMEFLKDSLGTSYGIDQILAILVQKIFKTKKQLLTNNTQKMICSEYVARFINKLGVVTIENLDSVTTPDLEAICRRYFEVQDESL